MGSWLSKVSPPRSTGWSALPPELLDLVLRRLSSYADRLRLASVCRHWRLIAMRYSAPTLPPVLPWLNFHDGTFLSVPDGERHTFGFSKQYRHCVGSFSPGWLLFEQAERRRPSRQRHFLKSLLLKTTVRLPGRCREPVDLNPDGSLSTGSGFISSRFFIISKVIVCSGDLIVAKVNYRRHRPCAVVCCRPGMSSWLTGLCNGHWYRDMAFYKGKLYTVTTEGHLFVHGVTNDADNGEPRVSRVEQVIQAPPPFKFTLDGPYATVGCNRTCYLVVSRTGKLLMVRWIVSCDCRSSEDSTDRKMILKVFEADFDMSRWLQVESFGDQVLFVSSYSSKAFSASSHHCHSLRGNQLAPHGFHLHLTLSDLSYSALVSCAMSNL
ncbi:hypothetical protein HU200_060805 [Digitaria exilis]|uniref:F-box domain-containing protein n=1 Tax=Digitaria exilis TaxID=1010633 RepID=A0A835E1Y9_9POAL|nr:hypothetical protein HU200_060805 [Digitaria exilis]